MALTICPGFLFRGLFVSLGKPPHSKGKEKRKGKERKGKEIGTGKSKSSSGKAMLKPCWSNFGAILTHLAHLGPILEPFLGEFGAILGYLRPSWGRLEQSWGRFEAILAETGIHV